MAAIRIDFSVEHSHEVVLTSNLAPGPQGFAVFRNVVGFYNNTLDMFADLVEQYGPLARLELGPYCFHVLTRPEHLQHVLVDRASNYRKSQSYGQTRAVVGLGLANNSEATWRRRRQLLDTAFEAGHLPTYCAIVAEQTQVLVERWQALAPANLAINVWLELLDLHYQILGQVLFGLDMQMAAAPVREALDTVRDITTRRINALVTLPEGLPTPENRRFHQAVAVLNEFTYTLIRERRKTPVGEDVLSQLCRLEGDSLTDEELRDELMSLFFSGYEDSANALTWALYLLAQHPAEAVRIRAELETIVGEESLTFEHLDQLEVLKSVVAESLRLYPPSWGIMRDAIADDEIDGCQIPAGSTVFLPLYLIHRLPEIWPEAHAFSPDQFSGGHLTEAQHCAYQPFGVGERQCIASGFALASMPFKYCPAIQWKHRLCNR
jgi:cytochrome P450